MKKFIKNVGRAIFYFSFIFFVACSVALASILIIKNNDFIKTTEEYNLLESKLQAASSGLDLTSQESKKTIDQLNSQIQTLETKNTELRQTLDSYQKTGDGIIEGKIAGQIILGQDNLSQYQLVCAKMTTNPSQIYCKSVSAISQTFELSLPAGKYTVYSKVLNKDNQVVLSEYSGKYTEYVKCLTEKGTGGCDVTLSGKQIIIEVKPTQKVANINPVDWN